MKLPLVLILLCSGTLAYAQQHGGGGISGSGTVGQLSKFTGATAIGSTTDPTGLTGITMNGPFLNVISDDDSTAENAEAIQVVGNITKTNTSSPGAPVYTGLTSTIVYGPTGFAAATGTAGATTNYVLIQGSANALNEFDDNFSLMRADIGTGYAQSAGPVGNMWFQDWNMHGPIAVQPGIFNGVSLFMNNHYNGSPSLSPSGGIWLQTKKSTGGGSDSLHDLANTYPIDVGLGCIGTSNAGADANGFTTCVQIGGSGGPWGITTSRVGTGINIRDFYTNAVSIHDAGSTTVVPFAMKGVMSQTANFVEISDSGSNIVTAVGSDGSIYIPGMKCPSGQTAPISINDQGKLVKGSCS